MDMDGLPPALADGGVVSQIQARRAAHRRKQALLAVLLASLAAAVAGPVAIGTSTGVAGGEGSGETGPIVAGVALLALGITGISISFVKIRAEYNA